MENSPSSSVHSTSSTFRAGNTFIARNMSWKSLSESRSFKYPLFSLSLILTLCLSTRLETSFFRAFKSCFSNESSPCISSQVITPCSNGHKVSPASFVTFIMQLLSITFGLRSLVVASILRVPTNVTFCGISNSGV